MGWRDHMGPASFRGAPFHVDTSERAGGRRIVTHEYPLRDAPDREDMGRKARDFSVEGYVLGEDYFVSRDKLLDALERAGPGELVHPYHGTRRVVVVDYRVRESKAEGGIARFSIEFGEAPAEPVAPTSALDAAAKLQGTVTAAKDAVGADFLSRYSPGPLVAAVSEALRSATLAIDNVLTRVSMETQKLAVLRRRVDAFTASAQDLLSTPADLLAGLLEILDGFDSDVAESLGNSLLEVYDFDPGVRPPATTPTRAQEQANFDAVHRLVQRLVVVQTASLAPLRKFVNYEKAVETRDKIADLLDEQAELATDDTYPALSQLRADLMKAVPGVDTALPRLVTHTPAATVPSLVLAHQLYGDVSLESDILDRNRVRRPGFVTGGRALEVLTRA
jgi:prophage DNA circulation protein